MNHITISYYVETWVITCFNIIGSCNGSYNGSGTEGIWGKLKSSLLRAAENMCGSTKKHQSWNETWWLLTVQSRKSGDAGKPGRTVAARRNIRRPSSTPSMLPIWQNPRLNKKSSRTLHRQLWSFPHWQPNETRKTGCPGWETCPQWRCGIVLERRG